MTSALTRAQVMEVLAEGEIAVEGRMVDSSNATLRVTCSAGGTAMRGIYKPRRGERPLWDFPAGSLGHREVAAGLLSDLLGWDLVPPTVWRESGPYGPGSCQLWVETDEANVPVEVLDETSLPPGWIAVAQGEGMHGEPVCLAHENTLALRRVALFDVLANNADRKGGHVLRALDGELVGIDHGLTFHVDDKLRTVLWGWAGEPLTDDERATVESLRGALRDDGTPLGAHLTSLEVAALATRADALIASGHFPEPSGAWPALPWPAM